MTKPFVPHPEDEYHAAQLAAYLAQETEESPVPMMTWDQYSNAVARVKHESEDGKVPPSRIHRCPECHGDGYLSSRCRWCAGGGWTMDRIRIYPYPFSRCTACDGKGECFTGEDPRGGPR